MYLDTLRSSSVKTRYGACVDEHNQSDGETSADYSRYVHRVGGGVHLPMDAQCGELEGTAPRERWPKRRRLSPPTEEKKKREKESNGEDRKSTRLNSVTQ